MRRTIAIKFIVEGYTRKTDKFLINCKECQTAQKNLNKLISSLPKATFSSERIHIDNMVHGKSKICVMYNSFSRLTKAFFIKTYASKEMIKCVEKWIEDVGTISILVSDNHRPLISSEFDDWLKDHNIYHIRSIPYRSISNGSVERGIQSVRHGLNQHLSLAQTITKINSSIGVDKLTNRQRFEMGKASGTPISLHDKYTVQVTALNGNRWYKVKYDDWKKCELVFKIRQSCFKFKDGETYHIRASDAVKLSTVTVTGEFKDQQLWSIHDEEVEKEPQDSLESSDAESTTTTAAPLNDDNEPINYLPDRCFNQFEVDAITKDFVDDLIVASDAAEANINNHTSKGKKVHGIRSTQKLELEAAVKGLEFLRANSKKDLLLSDSGFVCSSSQFNYDITAFPDLWSSFQEKRGETRIVHVSAHSKIVLNEMVDLFGKCYAAGIVDKDMEWHCDLNTAVIKISRV